MQVTNTKKHEQRETLNDYFYPPPKPCCQFHEKGGKAMDLCDWQLREFGHKDRESYEQWKQSLK